MLMLLCTATSQQLKTVGVASFAAAAEAGEKVGVALWGTHRPLGTIKLPCVCLPGIRRRVSRGDGRAG
jgi:hypothetical protein